MKGIIVAVVAVFGSIAFVVAVIASNKTDMKPSSKSEDANTSSQQTGMTDPWTHTAAVGYSSSGFTPKSVTIAMGDTVKFVNSTSIPMWIASSPHPDHTSLPEMDTSLQYGDNVPPGNKIYTFRFDKKGVWKYHNHSTPEHDGIVVVK